MYDGQVRHHLDPVADRQPPAPHPLIPAGLSLWRLLAVREALHPAHTVHDDVERAAGGDPWILLPQ